MYVKEGTAKEPSQFCYVYQLTLVKLLHGLIVQIDVTLLIACFIEHVDLGLYMLNAQFADQLYQHIQNSILAFKVESNFAKCSSLVLLDINISSR